MPHTVEANPAAKSSARSMASGTILATLGGIEIARQERSQERVTRTHGLLQIRYRFSQLAVITIAIIGNAALSASRCRYETRT